jgi:YidC/Oxa1 family membrane protein insertase
MAKEKRMNLQFLITPFAWALGQLFHVTGNFGWSIILFTVLIRVIILPLTLPALKSQRKMRELQPKLKELQKRHKGDKDALAKAQMALYKEHNFNPLGGCLPSLLQFVPLIIIYNVLQKFIHDGNTGALTGTLFLGIDMVQKDKTFILPILAAASQLILSLMIAPATKKPDVIPDASKDKQVQDLNKKEDEQQDMAEAMQKQMLFMAPVMTGIFAVNFPAGLALYWIASTVVSIVQQYFITGWGGLIDVLNYLPFKTKQKVSTTPADNLQALAKALSEQSHNLALEANQQRKIEKSTVQSAQKPKKSTVKKQKKSLKKKRAK